MEKAMLVLVNDTLLTSDKYDFIIGFEGNENKLIHNIDKNANTFSIFDEKKKDAQEIHKKRLQNIKFLINQRERDKKLLTLAEAIQTETKLDLIKTYAKELEKLLKGNENETRK